MASIMNHQSSLKSFTPNFPQEDSKAPFHQRSKTPLIQGTLRLENLKQLQDEVATTINQCEKQISAGHQQHDTIENKLVLIARTIKRMVGEQVFLNHLTQSHKRAANRYNESPSEAGGMNQSNHSSTQADSMKSLKQNRHGVTFGQQQQANIEQKSSPLDMKQGRSVSQSMKTVVDTLLRMQKDIEMKQADLRQRLSKSQSIKPVLEALEYQITSAFDIFLSTCGSLSQMPKPMEFDTGKETLRLKETSNLIVMKPKMKACGT